MVNINIQKKDLWLLSAIMVFLVGVGFVISYNPSGTGGIPSIMGHSADEIEGGAGFGASVSKNINTVYTAATSGILVVRAYISAQYEHNYVEIRSDDSTTPTTVVGHIGAYCTDNCHTRVYHTMSVPILKDKKYRVVQSGGGVVVHAIQFYPNN